MLKEHLAEKKKKNIHLNRCSAMKPMKEARCDLWSPSRMGDNRIGRQVLMRQWTEAWILSLDLTFMYNRIILRN